MLPVSVGGVEGPAVSIWKSLITVIFSVSGSLAY